MMTIEQAKQALQLSKERDALIERANKIRMAGRVYFSAKDESELAFSGAARYVSQAPVMIEVEMFSDEFRALVAKELKAQVSKIDKDLRSLGVEPDPFDAAAPVKTEEAA